MLVPISVDDLKPGMYVIIRESWLKHPFLKTQFLIRSQEQVDELKASGLSALTIDTDKGVGPDLHADPSLFPPTVWEPEKLVPPELREAIRDKTLPPEKKAEIVYRSSLILMERLFQDPKVEKIREAKEGISDIVDVVIADRVMAKNLVNITSYDFYTYTHSVNVGILSALLAGAIYSRSAAHDMHELGAGFFLHDIGKVRVDPAIVNKKGKLTEEEMGQMRMHPSQGYAILSEAGELSEECRIIVMQHHERQDGSGYPAGLRGDEIHYYSRICSIADVYDALTSERSYKKRVTPFEALTIMKEQMIDHFTTELFEKFVLLFG